MSKMQRTQSFHPVYLKEFDFIRKSNKRTSYTLCNVCNSSINISHRGKSNIVPHAKSSEHVSSFNKGRSSSKISNFMTSDSDNQTIKAELLFMGFTQEHNIPFVAADHISKLLTAMFSIHLR